MKILVIGESCLDVFHYGESVRLCPDAPVPVFKSLSITQNAGMAKNVQKNLTSLGTAADIITNEDWEEIIKTRYVDLRTNHMFLRVDEGDDRYRPITMEDVERNDFSLYEAVVVSDYNKGFLPPKILKEITRRHSLTFLDTKKHLGDWSKDYSFIKINHKEYEETKHTLDDQMIAKLIITRGPHGCEYRGLAHPVASVEVKDTSGAGDTFLAALAKAYVESHDISAAIEFANECATTVVQRRGVSVV